MSPPSATDPLLPNTNANNANTQPSSPEQPKLARRNMDRNIYWTLGCVYGASAVALGAFGAHGLKKRISEPQRIANFGTAAQYQVSTEVCFPSLSPRTWCTCLLPYRTPS